MAKKKKKILLLLAGGTCILDKQGQVFSVEKKDDIYAWQKQMPELSILADIETELILPEDENVCAKTWEDIARAIDNNILEYDGFVVVSKIDQLINTALAVNFLLQHFDRSIIFTSSYVSGATFSDKKNIISQLSQKHGGLALRTNLINAMQIADQPLPGAAILFGTRLIAATKAIFDLKGQVNLFDSIDDDFWGRVDFGINLRSGLSLPAQSTQIYREISARVFTFEDLPGVPWNFDKNMLDKYQAILIRVGPYQALDKDKQKQIATWQLPVVLYNYSAVSAVKGAIAVSGCTYNAVLLKMMWALANKKKVSDFAKVMQQNIIGEFI